MKTAVLWSFAQSFFVSSALQQCFTQLYFKIQIVWWKVISKYAIIVDRPLLICQHVINAQNYYTLVYFEKEE